MVDNLVKDIRMTGTIALTAGDIGYRYVLRALGSDAGRSDVIFDMNSRNDVPGYGYQLAQGATALTESWAGLSFRNRITILCWATLWNGFIAAWAGYVLHPTVSLSDKIEIFGTRSGRRCDLCQSQLLILPMVTIATDWKKLIMANLS